MAEFFDISRESLYPFWSEDKLRFGDVDRYGHVNNVSFARYAETGRVEFAETVSPGSADGKGVGWVIVRLNIAFRAQIHYPGTIRIGTSVKSIGKSSATLLQGLFCDDIFFSDTESVIVWTDIANSRSAPLPDKIRNALEQYQIQTATP